MGYSSEIANAWKKYLAEDDVAFEFDEKEGVLYAAYGLREEGAVRAVNVRIYILDNGYRLTGAIDSINCIKNASEKTAVLCNLVNNTLKYGFFIVDTDNGELLFQLNMRVPDKNIETELDYQYLDEQILTVLAAQDAYADAFVSVMLGYSDPYKAFSTVEDVE